MAIRQRHRQHPYQRGHAIKCPSCGVQLSHKQEAEDHVKSHPEFEQRWKEWSVNLSVSTENKRIDSDYFLGIKFPCLQLLRLLYYSAC